MTPYEYRELSRGKAVNHITALVFDLTGQKAFAGKPTQAFWRLRSFMIKQDQLKLNVLFDYLCTLANTEDSLSDMFVKAEAYRQARQIKPNKSKQYDDITLEDVMEL